LYFHIDVVSKKTFKRHILVYNLIDNEVTLVGRQNGSRKFEKNILPGRRTEEYEEVVSNDGQLPVPYIYTVNSSTASDVKFYINGADTYTVQWQEFDVYNVLFIVRSQGEMGGESKIYYMNIDFINLASGDASIQYKEFEDDRERVVFAGTQYTVDVVVLTTQRPEFNMIARQYNANKDYFLNGQPSWTIQGSEFKGERHVIRITDKGTFFNCFFILI